MWGALRPVFWGLIRTPPKYRDIDLIFKNIETYHQEVQILNDFLSDRPFIEGEEFSMVGIPTGCAVYSYYSLPEEFMR